MSEEDIHRVKVVNKRVVGPKAEEPQAAAAATEEQADAIDELARAREQAAQYLDDLQRLKAEFENYRKRGVKEQTALIERASAAVVEKLLPVLDDFDLALLAADRTKDYESMVRGIDLVYAKLREVLKSEGLTRIDTVGKLFDPELHEAVMSAEGEGDEIVVVEEMRPGYTLGGRVVRPAMVKVGRK